MSFPFGSTSLGAYLVWANQSGCTVQSGYGPDGGTFNQITTPDGKKVIIPDMEQSERLTSTYLNYLDRRLGMRSPFDRAE